MPNIKRLYQKLFKPSFWVCEYEIQVDNPRVISKESGQFACFGKDEDAAFDSAALHIQKTAQVSGDCSYKVRRPNLAERMDSLS